MIVTPPSEPKVTITLNEWQLIIRRNLWRGKAMTARKKCTAEFSKPKPPKSSRLTVLWKVEPKLLRNGRRVTQFLCQCICGNKVKVERCKIQNGHKRSCGCLRADTIKAVGNASRLRRKEREELANAQ